MVKRTPEEMRAYIKKQEARKPITPRQARLALLQAGLLDQVQASFDTLSAEDKAVAEIEWEYAVEISRDAKWINKLAPALGLTQDQLDELFIAAQKL